jgi:hypothetical protein
LTKEHEMASHSHRSLLAWLFLIAVGVVLLRAASATRIAAALQGEVPAKEEAPTIFSGPQPNEELPACRVAGVFDDEAGKEWDVVERAKGGPQLIIFVHKATRPSIGLTRLVTDWAATRKEDGLDTSIVWLAKDRSEAERYVARARGSLDFRAPLAISVDGEEGPGAWGLHRGVELTIITGKEGKATANFALVQPSDTDAAKVFDAVVAMVGGKAPSVAELRAQRAGGRGRGGAMSREGGSREGAARDDDAELNARLRAVIQKESSAEEIARAIAALEEYIRDKPEARAQLGRMTSRVVGGELFAQGAYGREEARTKLREWAEAYGPKRDDAAGSAASRPRERVRARLGAHLSFHASFDKFADADFGRGDVRIHTAPGGDVSKGQPGVHRDDLEIAAGRGRYGNALRLRKNSSQWLYWRADRNVAWRDHDWSGTIAFWMRLDPDRDLEPGYCDPFQMTDAAWNDAAIFVDFTKDDMPRQFRLGLFADLATWNPTNKPWEEIAPADRPMAVVERPAFSRERWTHVAVTFTGLNRGDEPGRATLWMDGKDMGSVERPRQIFTWDAERSVIFIGVAYIGEIDDLAIFDRALTAEELDAFLALEGGAGELVPPKER